MIKKLIAARKQENSEDKKAVRGAAGKRRRTRSRRCEKLRATQETQVKQTEAVIKNLRAEMTKLKSETTKLTDALKKATKAATSSTLVQLEHVQLGLVQLVQSSTAAGPDWAGFAQWLNETSGVTAAGGWQERSRLYSLRTPCHRLNCHQILSFHTACYGSNTKLACGEDPSLPPVKL